MVKMSYYADYSNYTDSHEVDEDERTISAQGGDKNDGTRRGMMNRNLYDTPATVLDFVASKCQHL